MNVVGVIYDRSELAMRRKKNIKLLMEEPYFESAVDEVRQDITQNWMDTVITDITVREKLYAEITALDMVLDRLRSYANDVTFRVEEKEKDNAS